MANTHSLPGDMTIYAAGPLGIQFKGWIAELRESSRDVAVTDVPLPVDASGVNDIDAAGVQTLLSLSKSLTTLRRPLQLIDPSGPLVSACGALGIESVLMASLSEEARA